MKLNGTQTSNETITEVKEDMLTKETDQLIQDKGNSLVSMYMCLNAMYHVICNIYI